jgi:aldehyde dehydrogenase
MVDKILADIANRIAIRPHYDNFIGSKWVPAVKGQTFDNISPIDGRVVCTVARSTAEDVELALDAAHAARESWGRTSPAERSLALLRIADRIEQKLDLLALVETIDNGKPIRETKAADLPLAVDHFRYFAGCIRAQEGSLSEIDHDTVAYHFHEPLGVVGQIIPWNFPILMAVWKLAPALAAGNCVLLKPAEQTPMSIMVLMDMIGDLLPPGVLNVINGFGVEAGKPLAQSKRVAKVAFTGETTTGRLIMQYASDNIIPVTLELGGKSPNIFFEDVAAKDDEFFDKALEGLAMFAFNQGEVCTCPSRALVHEKIYDRFMERAIARVKAMKQGNPLDTATMVGAQASNDQLEKILSYLDIGRQEGAKVLIGGARADVGPELSGGFYVQPTILEGHNKMRIFQEEIFGPVLSVTKFKDDEEALSIANDSLYGLGAGVWTAMERAPIVLAARFKLGVCGSIASISIRRMRPSAVTSSQG